MTSSAPKRSFAPSTPARLPFQISFSRSRGRTKSTNLRSPPRATSTAAPRVALTLAGFGPMTYNVGTGRYTITTITASSPGTVTVTSDRLGTQVLQLKAE